MPHAMENLAKNVAINTGRKEGEEPRGAQGSHCSNGLGRASLRRADREGKDVLNAMTYKEGVLLSPFYRREY